jgi:octaprenyl-diphosphate synthase
MSRSAALQAEGDHAALALPGGPAVRRVPAGLGAGAPLSRIDGPGAALGLVSAELAAAESRLSELVVSDVAAVPAVAGYLVDAGGKRLRPALTALGARAVGDTAPLASLMCVGELIHLGSLLHDDVVDDGVTRRGRTAAHRVYGSAVSVLTGDFCLARAVLLAADEGGPAAVRALAAVVTEMAEGEVLQLQRAGDLSCSLDAYLDVIERKSAALISWCASAAAHRSAPDCVDALESYGRGVGIAFQITDDVLDYSSRTGKGIGNDLRERKVTLPLIYGMEAVPGLRDALADGPPSDAAVRAFAEQIRSSGALDAALADAHGYVDRAVASLGTLPQGDAVDALAVLGRYLVERVR